MSLIQTLHKRLAQDQAISFADFMQVVLYAPADGYYSSGLHKLGRDGDFITAPELSPLFGKTLARQCQQIMARLENPVIMEYGAGTGRLCVDVLQQLEEMQCLPNSYFILEVSANLRHRQEQLVNLEIPHLAHKVRWLQSWPEVPFNGVILANEVLDAMPVHRFMKTEQGIMESFITLNDRNELVEIYKPCQNQRLLTYLITHLTLDKIPFQSEVNLFIDDWMANNYRILNQGAMILIDYGFPRHEYYHPDRNQGTLMCHYRHHAHPDPLLHPGEQDISAHVDFTHVAEAGDKAGFHIAGFTNQASFLLGNDLLSLVNLLYNPQEEFKAKQAIKQLTHPGEMGELFKVMALTKNLELELNGFQIYDKRANL